MTKREKLLEQFGAAIIAILGDTEEEEFNNDITEDDINLIANKVKFYMDL